MLASAPPLALSAESVLLCRIRDLASSLGLRVQLQPPKGMFHTLKGLFGAELDEEKAEEHEAAAAEAEAEAEAEAQAAARAAAEEEEEAAGAMAVPEGIEEEEEEKQQAE